MEFSDFFPSNEYEVRELSRNREGGRITYLVSKKNKKEAKVIVKQFRFANDASWTGYEAHQREIKALERLDHRAIPRYGTSRQTSDGFFLVQEYKDAPSLAGSMEVKKFSFSEIHLIATEILSIFIYLHETGHLCHGDIKPENILVDLSKKPSVYLVDFGLARTNGDSVTATTLLGGTPGFIPYDQILRRELKPDADLFGLGATLIALLTNTQSINITKFIDSTTHRFSFRQAVPKTPAYFLSWIDRLVAPDPKRRFPSARAALEALQSKALVKGTNRTVRWELAIGAGVLSSILLGSAISLHLSLQRNKQEEALTKVTTKAEGFYDNVLDQQRKKREISAIEKQKEVAQRKKSNRHRLLTTGSCRGCNLEGVNLESANLAHADLREANLRRASLSSAKLENANLTRANLEQAVLINSNVRRANFQDANLTKANFEKANAVGASFRFAQLSEASLAAAILEEADFRSANLSGAYFWRTVLDGANFEMAKVSDLGGWFTSKRGTILPNGTKHE